MSGLQINERPDGILVFEFKELSRDAIDEWVHQILKTQKEYDENKEHLRLLYFHEIAMSSSPYAVNQTIHVLSARPSTLVYSTAVVVPSLELQMVAQHINNRIPNAKNTRIFRECEEAIDWLNERHRMFQEGLPLED